MTIVVKKTIIYLAYLTKNQEEMIMRQLGCAILCLALILCLSGCACKHEWAEATCTEPKTCTKCGETEGDPLEHTPGEWVQDEPDYVTGLV